MVKRKALKTRRIEGAVRCAKAIEVESTRLSGIRMKRVNE